VPDDYGVRARRLSVSGKPFDCTVGDQQADVLRRMPGRVHHLDDHIAERQPLTVHRAPLERDFGGAVQLRDRCNQSIARSFERGETPIMHWRIVWPPQTPGAAPYRLTSIASIRPFSQ
jgi:hypothetical protein